MGPIRRCRRCCRSWPVRAKPWRSADAGAPREFPMQADVERFLARLLTDRAFRERFLADPAAVASQEGLSPEEAQAVAAMPTQDLRTAARSYQHKRDSKVPRGVHGRLMSWLSGKR